MHDLDILLISLYSISFTTIVPSQDLGVEGSWSQYNGKQEQESRTQEFSFVQKSKKNVDTDYRIKYAQTFS